MMKKIVLAVACVCVSLSTVVAQENVNLPPAIEKFVGDDTIAIGHLDLTNLRFREMVDWAEKNGSIGKEDAVVLREKWAGGNREVVDQLRRIGIPRAYMLLSASDVLQRAPVLVMPIANAERHNRAELAEGIHELLEYLDAGYEAVVVRDGFAIASDTEDRINEVLEKKPVDRPEVAAAWHTIKESQLGMVVIGDEGSREIMRQLFPPLPSPFEAVTGEMIADDLKWASVVVGLPPTPSVKLVVEAANPQAVTTLSDATTAGKKMVSEMNIVGVDEDQGSIIKQMVAKLNANSNANRFELDLDQFLSEERGQMLLGTLLRQAFGASLDNKRLNNLKNIILAMFNFESAHGFFPAYATFDADKKPLLSWRVQILPYLEENDLYEKFHHDEPWDSEHNLKLVQEMPFPFRDAANPGLNASGKTRYLCPYGKGYFMEGDEPLHFRSFTDGTSNTISLVRVNPDHAVPWTKPADWEVDAEDPWKGLRSKEKREKLIATMSDGSAHRYSQEMDPKVLQSILSRNGGEPVDRESLK